MLCVLFHDTILQQATATTHNRLQKGNAVTLATSVSCFNVYDTPC